MSKSLISLPGKSVQWFKQLRKKHKNILLISSLTGILFLVGTWAVLFSKDAKTTAPDAQASQTSNPLESTPQITVTLSYIEGTVEYKEENGTWSDAEVDKQINTGEGIRTVGAGSRAIITLPDSSVIRVDANTEFEFDTLTESRIVLKQESGYLYNRIVKSDTRVFAVHTENAEFQAVGTAFRTISTGDEEAVETYQSSVSETRSNTTATEGEKFIAKSPANPGRDKTKERLDIEKLKTDTFISWNRQQDEKDPNFKSALGFLKDIEGPKIEGLEPAAGSSIELAESATSGSVTIKGKTEKGATLTVQSKSQSGSTPTEVTVGEDGSFDTGAISASLGSSVFELIAKDKTGNITKLSVTYTFKRKAVIQQQGIVLSIDDSDPNDFKLSWSLVGLTTPEGVKILYSEDEDVGFDDVKKFVEAGLLDITVSKKDPFFKKNKPYYFSVCRYDKDTNSCDTFSNKITVSIED